MNVIVLRAPKTYSMDAGAFFRNAIIE